ncbi:ABC transporter permease [Phytoactinopolyspora halotolerans]|uniref:Transport permease protein n=1 Tax=Phytoactinopolyspora halotolerans TaxID=1981512 RepID=A0A6L9S3P3_9ACTN|nr:ABC transporter permease [Phytoactinopolyspora halotolerans]NED98589.1 ABC transporter permease [Phytoactinopolyspora halotolerans]
MTTPNQSHTPTSTPTPSPSSSAFAAVRAAGRRIRAMSRAEVRLLTRNTMAMVTALAMPALLVVFTYATSDDAVGERMELGSFITVAMTGFVLLFVVYYNLVSSYVARREELVLKRLRTSEATDFEILAGTAVPALLIGMVQVILVAVASAALLDLGVPVNPILVVVGVLGGAAVFVLLAAASTAFTRTVESAQVSTLPLVLVSMVLSGMMVPLDTYPDMLGDAARLLPLTPVVELIQLGLEGTDGTAAAADFTGTFSEALAPSAVLLVWIYLGVYAVRRWFRWEPRT